MVYLRKLVRGLGESEPGPSSLATDSQSARSFSYKPEHHDRMKHVQRCHFFIRDMVKSFELEVPFVRTADNLADFFTKTMKSASQFHAFRETIMDEPLVSTLLTRFEEQSACPCLNQRQSQSHKLRGGVQTRPSSV